jgi:type I site-specific restriction endonuclease
LVKSSGTVGFQGIHQYLITCLTQTFSFQLFDCSIFTKYTDADLSCMSENMSKQLRSRLAQEESKKSEEQPQDLADEQQPQHEADQARERVKEAQRLDQTMALVSQKILVPREDLFKGKAQYG